MVVSKTKIKETPVEEKSTEVVKTSLDHRKELQEEKVVVKEKKKRGRPPKAKTKVAKKEVKKGEKLTLQHFKDKYKQNVLDVILYTTRRVKIDGKDEYIETDFRDHINRIEAQLAKGPVSVSARGRGSTGLVANIANFYVAKERDGYQIVEGPSFIRGLRPKGKHSIPTYDIELTIEGPYIKVDWKK